MRPLPQRLAKLPEQRWVALLLTIWLIGAQLLLALHQIDHLLAEHDEDTCLICLVGHGLNHAGTASVTIPAVVLSAFVIARIVPVVIRLVTPTPYQSRAPPR